MGEPLYSQRHVTEQNSTKLWNMLQSEPGLQTHLKNLRGFPLKIAELKLLILDDFQLHKLCQTVKNRTRVFNNPLQTLPTITVPVE